MSLWVRWLVGCVCWLLGCACEEKVHDQDNDDNDDDDDDDDDVERAGTLSCNVVHLAARVEQGVHHRGVALLGCKVQRADTYEASLQE